MTIFLFIFLLLVKLGAMKVLRISALILIIISIASGGLISISPEEKAPPGFEYRIIKPHIKRNLRSEFKDALKLMEKDDYSSALQIFKNLSEDMDNEYIWWGRGYCEYRIGNYSDALTSYRFAYTINDTLPEFLRDYGRLLLLIFDKWEEGSRLLVKVYEKNREPNILIILIESALRYKHINEGLSLFDSLAVLYPRSPDILIYYASFLSGTGEDLQAAIYAREAAALTKDRLFLKHAVQILAKNNYFEDAHQILNKIRKIKRRSSEYWEARGYLALKEGDYDDAVQSYEKALNLNYSVKNLLKLAEIEYYYRNDMSRARYYCKAILRETERLPQPYYILAEIERKKTDYEEALRLSALRINTDPSNPEFHYYHGKLLIKLRRFNQAVEELQKAVELNPDKQRYRLVLAKTLAHLGRYEEARSIYENFLKEPLRSLWEDEKKGISPEE